MRVLSYEHPVRLLRFDVPAEDCLDYWIVKSQGLRAFEPGPF